MRKSDFYRHARSDLRGPLHGLRVVEATTTWAGPMCGCLLADFGADVIKVEHPAGEVARHAPPALPGSDPPVSAMHATVNRNKRSLRLDIARPDGAKSFRKLAARADVVIENFRPGILEGWGLGYRDLHKRRVVAERNPRRFTARCKTSCCALPTTFAHCWAASDVGSDTSRSGSFDRWRTIRR